MSAISQVKSITGVNLLTIKLGYFLAKSAGILFLSKRNTVMEEQESLKMYISTDREYKNYLNPIDLPFLCSLFKGK